MRRGTAASRRAHLGDAPIEALEASRVRLGRRSGVGQDLTGGADGLQGVVIGPLLGRFEFDLARGEAPFRELWLLAHPKNAAPGWRIASVQSLS